METFLLSVVGIIIYVVIYKIAVSKNRNPVVWILICVIATPFCIIILLLLDKLPQDSMMKSDFKSTGFSIKRTKKKTKNK